MVHGVGRAGRQAPSKIVKSMCHPAFRGHFPVGCQSQALAGQGAETKPGVPNHMREQSQRGLSLGQGNILPPGSAVPLSPCPSWVC